MLPRMKPVFVGGTGRSGTTVTARLIGSHPTYFMFPTEVRFIAAKGGLCDLVAGNTDPRRFEKLLMGKWFQRDQGGLHLFTDRANVEAVFRRHRAGLKSDPRAAAPAFTHDLLDPIAAARGATSWVEMTPPNAGRRRCSSSSFRRCVSFTACATVATWPARWSPSLGAYRHRRGA